MKNGIIGLSDPEKIWISLCFNTYEHLEIAIITVKLLAF